MTPDERARVVLDTNVFVGAGFNPDSASAALLEAVRTGRLRMPWTDGTRGEVRRILEKIPPLSWSDAEDLFREGERRSGDLGRADLPWVPDPEDRKFAALARDAGAVLVSADHHLLGRRDEAGFDVLTPTEARRRLLGG